MNQDPERILYRLIIDHNNPIPAISSYRAVRNALAALARGARSVHIESTPADAIDWERDTQSMELLEDELMRQATTQPSDTPISLPFALRKLGNACTVLAELMQAAGRETLYHAETEALANAIQKVIFLMEQEEESH